MVAATHHTAPLSDELANLLAPHLAEPDHADAVAADVLELLTEQARLLPFYGDPDPATVADPSGATPIHDQLKAGGC